MKRVFALIGAVGILLVVFAAADTVILRNGESYSGHCDIPTVVFLDLLGIKYKFPARDVQSLSFNGTSDTVVLRNGKSYTGHFGGLDPVSFAGSEGIKYQFPTTDIDAIVFSGSGANSPPAAGSLVIPVGSDFPVHTNEAIDSTQSYEGQTYAATITEDVRDSNGNVAIPAGSAAKLLVRSISSGGAIHSAELILDLFSVSVDKKQYMVASSDVVESNKRRVGANRRTAELLGGGSALGALMGGIFGGGRGVGIGAAAGAGGGFLTQAFTRGKEVKIPAEAMLRFRLEKALVLQSAS